GRMTIMAVSVMTALAGTAGCASMQDKMNASGEMGAAAGGMESSGGMGMSGGMRMSDADKKMMASCMAMDHEQMMGNSRCAEMAKMHPEMHNRMNAPK
ncbi:MAG: hypothetical protein KY449_13385, partial [Proteobacteria bacterium]|nr:hypothetical protein [Pseudomonadota bacterium]